MAVEKTMGELIRAAVLPIVPVCDPVTYDGDAKEYCTYNMTEIPVHFGDNAPEAIRYLVQVHWFLPVGTDPTAKKRRLKRALAEIGTYPEVENASDLKGQHFVFEFEAVDGDV